MIFFYFLVKLRSNIFIIFCFLIILFWANTILFQIDLKLFGTNNFSSNESNFLKTIINYGIFGSLFYIYILAKLFEFLKFKNFYIKLIASNIIIYQFISPHVISGFVIFMPFVIIINLLRK